MTNRQPIVAIDGPAGSGKSTVAKLVAERAGLVFVSSGAMYRAVALRTLQLGVSPGNIERLTEIAGELVFRFVVEPGGEVRTLVDGVDVTDDLNKPEIGQLASSIATIPQMRARLVAKQQAFGREGGVVMEGRDIQTVVFPDADIKIFLTASAEERAQRRWAELHKRGEDISYERVLDGVKARDRQDESRAASPLRPAPDAIHIDTDDLTIEQVVERIVKIIATWRINPRLQGESLARAANIV